MSSTATLKDPNTLLFQQPERLAAFTVPKNLFVLYLIYQRGARTKAEISQELTRIIHEEARGEQELDVMGDWWAGGCSGAGFAKAEGSDLVLGWC